jgi:murein DD-endopeptidase MepM/ murein hydrolase activator NlpD
MGWPGTTRSVILASTAIALSCLAVAQWWIARPGADEMTRPTPNPAATAGPALPVAAPPPAGAALLIPVVGVRPSQLVDTFTQSRAGGSRPHDAIDIVAARGTPVVAAAAGRVEKLFRSRDGGMTVYVRSPDGATLYYYAHLDSYADGLAEGAQVRRGTLLGTVGATGNADPAAPHLHFAMWRTTPAQKWWEPAAAFNPYPLLRGAAR